MTTTEHQPAEIFYWRGRESSPDRPGWYRQVRGFGSTIVDVVGPYKSREEAERSS